MVAVQRIVQVPLSEDTIEIVQDPLVAHTIGLVKAPLEDDIVDVVAMPTFVRYIKILAPSHLAKAISSTLRPRTFFYVEGVDFFPLRTVCPVLKGMDISSHEESLQLNKSMERASLTMCLQLLYMSLVAW